MGKRAAFYTLGCKVNQFDTEAMRELFTQAGYETVDFDQVADVYLINTCTVTATGDQKSRQMISRACSGSCFMMYSLPSVRYAQILIQTWSY